MHGAHAVVEARAADRERSLIEAERVLRTLAKRAQAVFALAEIADQRREVTAHHLVRKDVVTGRDRRVGREDRRGGHDLERGLEIDSVAHAFAQPLQHEKGRMSFVDVPDRGVQAQRAQRAHAADAEHDLLRNAHLAVPAIEFQRDAPVVGRVCLDIGVEQHESDVAQATDPGAHRDVASEQVDVQAQRLAACVLRLGEGEVGALHRQVTHQLSSFAVDLLAQVARAVEEAHRDEGQAQVARRLAMVTGQHAEAAGVQRQALMQAVFGAEVGDEIVRRIERTLDTHVARLLQVAAVGRKHRLVLLQEHRVCRRRVQCRLRHAAQEHLRVVSAGVPQLAIEITEQRLDAPIPGVGQVVGERRQARQRGRHHGLDLELDTGFVHGVQAAGWGRGPVY